MTARIEDYALIGDCHTAALVRNDGSIDWFCVPNFDSAACFAALLGTADNGRWQIHPQGEVKRVRRRYRDKTLVLETEFETETGTVAIIDFMPPRLGEPKLIRVVEGRSGRVPIRMELVIRFDYGSIVPWVRRTDHGLSAVAGPDRLMLQTAVDLHGENFHTTAEFVVHEGHQMPFALSWSPSDSPEVEAIDAAAELARTEVWWRDWLGGCRYQGEWAEAVHRSLITLKAMTYAPSGGIVAAPTASLPVVIGGDRNWDYRYCWLRDATFTLLALLEAGFREEADAWRAWLLRAVAGKPSELKIMYGLRGERRLPELAINWLPGYEGSSPVRVGNAAHAQFQLDVYGEVMDAMHHCLKAGLGPGQDGWRLERALLEFLETGWTRPDDGIWELRVPRRHYTHSKLMAWVAFDRAVKSAENFGFDGPIDEWRAHRDAVHEQVCREGFNAARNAFVQTYGSDRLDASLLMMPIVGFLPARDPRVVGTVEAIQKTLVKNGLVARYESDPVAHPNSPSEPAFLLCNFWMADNLHMMGRAQEARRLFERLLALGNDVGLLSECYDPAAERFCGNFPQAFSHIGLVNTAFNLSREIVGPADERSEH